MRKPHNYLIPVTLFMAFPVMSLIMLLVTAGTKYKPIVKSTQHIDTTHVKSTIYDTVTYSVKQHGIPEYEMCDDELTIKGVIINDSGKRKYMYLVTDGCSDTLGGNNGLKLYSDKEYKIGQILILKEE